MYESIRAKQIQKFKCSELICMYKTIPKWSLYPILDFCIEVKDNKKILTADRCYSK